MLWQRPRLRHGGGGHNGVTRLDVGPVWACVGLGLFLLVYSDFRERVQQPATVEVMIYRDLFVVAEPFANCGKSKTPATVKINVAVEINK